MLLRTRAATLSLGLLERQGFFPEKITVRVLQYMEEQIQKSKKKTMKISKVQRQQRREA
ncbi:hypothetical protein ACS4JF_20480 [Bacillus thuringiensis]|uniref:hypothetical protein n=1 Tax=Bacillus cereus group TaxID=86661 RepID=UPI0016426ABE|nr:hypothetical protein [Bacillus mycoides]